MVRILGAVCLCASLVAAKEPVTLEALAKQPPVARPGAPVWSPDGARFVYTEGGKLWLYDVPSKAKTELLTLASLDAAASPVQAGPAFDFENRRVSEQLVQWTPSGRELLLGRGDLFLFRLQAGGWTQLTHTTERERDPKLSPDGRIVAFRRGHDLYVLDLATRKEVRLTTDGSATLLNGELDWVYPEELDLGTAYWWSPDSRSIAYLQFDVSREPFYPQTDLTGTHAVLEQQRYPRAGDPNADVRLGVVPAAGGATRWMDTGSGRDTLLARVDWLPDSSAVAVVRLNRIQNRLDLLAADARSGESRLVLRETDPFWVNVQDGPRFLKGGKEFLWQSESDGFNHLYRYSIDGKLLSQLTRGEWEVSQTACVDEKAGRVYFVSSETGPLERQLYRVSLTGGDRKLLSQGAGTHAISMNPACTSYLDTYSNLTTPSGRTLRTADGGEWAVFSAPDKKPLERYEFLPSEIVSLKGPDGTQLFARMIKPAGFDPAKKYPVIVDVYGGPGAQDIVNRWPGVLSIDQVLAQRGYIVWALDNRGTRGRGHKFEAAVFRNLGERELEDQKAGIQHLISLGFADPKRIGIHGWSYGGFMTLRALLFAPDVFACGIAGAPVTQWVNYDTIYTERFMGLPSENAEAYRKSSLVPFADQLKGKVLIAHNLEDDNVLFQNTVQMADALERAGKQFELMFYTNKTHGLVRGRNHFNELTVSFFDRMLK